MSEEKRNTRYDSLKYCLLVLVITGHIFAQDRFYMSNQLCRTILYSIYIFHMPLFVFISEYFSHKMSSGKFITGSWKLLEPLVVYQAFFLCMEYHLNGSVSIEDILTPYWTLWYLLSLFFWRLMLQIIPNRILDNKKSGIVLTFCIAFLAGFLPLGKFLSLQRTFAFLPFFFLGYSLRGKNLILPKKCRLWCILFLMIILMCVPFCYDYLGDLNQSYPYKGINGMLGRMLTFGLSIPMSLAFICICPNTPWIAKQGRNSMQYYVYHTLINIAIMVSIDKFCLPTSFPAAVGYVAVVVFCLGLASYLPLFHTLTNPLSYLWKKISTGKTFHGIR